MIEKIKAAFEAAGDNKIQGIIDALKIVVGAILGFIAGEEGYDFPADAE